MRVAWGATGNGAVASIMEELVTSWLSYEVREGIERRRVLFRVLTGRLESDSAELGQAMQAARRAADLEFFRMLFEVDACAKFHDPSMSNLERFLLTHWDKAADGLPPLYHFDRCNLERVCRHVLNRPKMDPGSMEKARYRLGLPTCRLERWEARILRGKLKVAPKSQARR